MKGVSGLPGRVLIHGYGHIKKGDSLWNIAKRQLGDPLKWDIIYQLNSSTVKNPDLIYEGLDIPKA